ncbi:hypothetical protein Acr_15g0000750 [Actinidia rufa]|uniref:Uncharacterized protein n=1 Tax=Actinidia rufa TaxID=165716 RepID=A0A7J0FRX6_9ERIC|nr:hypothetical protein Acr_15g0000750 [Actinidia rufa]
MGQFRVRRSSTAAGKKISRKTPLFLFLGPKHTILPPKNSDPDRFDPIGANASGLSHLGCRKSKTRDDSAKIEPTMENKNRARDSEDEAEAEMREESREAFSSTLPPKNAFLLNRCRSSPYRSSSLASRFWGSPLEKSEAEDDNGERPTSESEPSCKKSALESKLDREIERKFGFSINGMAK